MLADPQHLRPGRGAVVAGVEVGEQPTQTGFDLQRAVRELGQQITGDAVDLEQRGPFAAGRTDQPVPVAAAILSATSTS